MEPALIAALGSEHEQLQVAALNVLSLLPEPTSQRSIAHVAMDGGNGESLRLSAFSAVAESAKRNGNLLQAKQIADLVMFARDEANLTLREAASRTLGALNLASNKASEIIRKYYGG